jgi:hypothetical protein
MCLVEPEEVLSYEGRSKNKNAHTRWAFLFFGVPTGIRTPVTAVKGRCPRPLDDGDRIVVLQCYEFCGGDKQDRTADLLHAMQALSQLSYTPTWKDRNYSRKHRHLQSPEKRPKSARWRIPRSKSGDNLLTPQHLYHCVNPRRLRLPRQQNP